MSAALKIVRQQDEVNIYALYQSLLHGQEVADIEPLTQYGVYAPDAEALHNAHLKHGAEGVKAYVAQLNNRRQKQKLLHILTASLATSEPESAASQVGVLLSEVKSEQVQWLWNLRLALGKMTMLDGDPGLGKSLTTLDLAARVSTGREMPDGSPGLSGGVVLITPEDGLADTIRPRLERAGADLTRIVSIGTIPTSMETAKGTFNYDRPFTLPDDLETLEAAIDRVQAKLIIIDPVMAIIGTGTGKNTSVDNEVRAILSPVKMLIEKAGAACLLVRHITKSKSENPLHAGMGSMAFIGLSRTGLMVAKDPNNEESCVFAHIKSNIGKLAPALTYHITSEELEDERPRVIWDGLSSITINDILSTPHKNTGNNRQVVLDTLRKCRPEEKSVGDLYSAVAEEVPDLTVPNLRMLLTRMVKAGEIGKSERGMYHAI